VHEIQQLAALSSLNKLFAKHQIEYWLFGGWAVDFHAGRVTRSHDDLDLVVRLDDDARAQKLLRGEGWREVPHAEAGYTVWELGGVRVELALADVGDWPAGSFGDDVRELREVRARVVSLSSLKADKAEVRDDPNVAKKDSADLSTLIGLKSSGS
jgi:Uncharacterised nucleotidyltransferase